MKAVLDLFAGTGVGVACHQLGVPEHGVEIWGPAIATREVVGFNTPYNDVWDIQKAEGIDFDTLWASPPCQTFSAAGKGKGREALDQIINLVESGVWKDVVELKKATEPLGDDRTGLVLTPLSYIHRFGPTYIALEQVPTVLPVWRAYAEVLERCYGYSVWVGYLHAEQYGVPQTRKRAFLIARRDGETAEPPVPTHSKYYPRDPSKFDGGVLPWVSMAEALGWGMTSAPSPTITGHLGVTRSPSGTQKTYLREIDNNEFTFKNADNTPSKRATSGIGAMFPPGHVNINNEEGGVLQSYPAWCFDRPSTTVVGTFRPDVISPPGYRTVGGPSRQNAEGGYVSTVDERTTPMSYDSPFPFQGTKGQIAQQIGNAVPPLLARRVLETFL